MALGQAAVAVEGRFAWSTRLGALARAGALLAALVQACDRSAIPLYDEREAAPGGQATTAISPFPSLDRPAPNMPLDQKPTFYAGRALARQPWVKAPTGTSARDGLGPLYNARTCLTCHQNGGKGQAPRQGKNLVRGLVRLSIPGHDAQYGAVPEPTYGLQLQTQSTALSHQLHGKVSDAVQASVPPEATVRVAWRQHDFQYPDGARLRLRRPELQLFDLGYGPMHPDTQFSLRIAPPMYGAGLIELISERDIAALADPEDRNGDGIAGRENQVWDFRGGRRVPGRFGYKANRATLEITVAGAFASDIGITNALFPGQPCSAVQTRCAQQPHGAGQDGVELSDELLALVVDYSRNLGVPKRRFPEKATVLAGRRLFYEAGCTTCHHPRFKTGPSTTHPHLAHQVIWPYSDFLLHDMGPALADGRPDYAASGQEWRTTPLWGVGLNGLAAASYLHDGRARTLEEAVLWHGGEALAAKERFVAFPQRKREELLSFLASL